MPFAPDTAGNPSVFCRREYSGINALLVEPSQDALANHSYAVTLRLSRFEIDSVDSAPHVDKFIVAVRATQSGRMAESLKAFDWELTFGS
jgi:hypothetical protein